MKDLPKKESIQYTMSRQALANVTNENTAKAYKHDIKQFSVWCREQGYKTVEDIYKSYIPVDPDSLQRLCSEKGFQTKEDIFFV